MGFIYTSISNILEWLLYSWVNILESSLTIYRHHITIIWKYVDMVCYKRNILLLSLLNYVEHWNDTWTDNIQSFKLLFELPFLLQIELEVNLLDWNVNGLENE